MNLEPFFILKNGKLYSKTDGSELLLDSVRRLELAVVAGTEMSSDAVKTMISQFIAQKVAVVVVSVPWSLIELSDGNYNEGILAGFRLFLKKLEASPVFVIIAPRCDDASCVRPLYRNGMFEHETAEAFIGAVTHTARRVKDCTAVIGFALPPELLVSEAGSTASLFIEALSVKHRQYFYFAEKTEAGENDLIPYHLR
jgi:hypothetical protein